MNTENMTGDVLYALLDNKHDQLEEVDELHAHRASIEMKIQSLQTPEEINSDITKIHIALKANPQDMESLNFEPD